MRWRRLATVATAAVVLAAGPAATAGAAAAPTVDTQEVEFTISWENCDELGEGSTIEGSGTLLSSTVESTRRNGVTVARNVSFAVGTATDQAGNTYTWSYENRFRATNTSADPTSFRGTMIDEFELAGTGPERLHNGFVADIAYVGSTEATFAIYARHAFGDPLEFGDEPMARCDPI